MADITRNVGDVTPHTFINPGVRDDSLSDLLKNTNEIGLSLDQHLAEKRLSKALGALDAEYALKSPAAQNIQDGVIGGDSTTGAPQITSEERKDLNDFEKIRQKTLASVDQGRMSHAQYKLLVDRYLRQAIARRPGLAAEFRDLAGFHSGSEAINLLAAGEDALNKKGERDATRIATMRANLISVGRGDLAQGTDEQVMQGAEDPDIKRLIFERSQHEYRKTHLEGDVSIHESGRTLNRDEATDRVLENLEGVRLGAVFSINEVLSGGQFLDADPVQRLSMVTQLVTKIDEQIALNRDASSNGRVDMAAVNASIAGLEAFKEHMKSVVDGSALQGIQDTEVKSLLSMADALLLKGPAGAGMAALNRQFGPAFVEHFASDPTLRAHGLAAISHVLLGNASPRDSVGLAGNLAARSIAVAFDKGNKGKKPTDDEKASVTETIISLGANFAVIDENEYKAVDFVGHRGYATVVESLAKTFKEGAGEDNANALAVTVAQGAFNHRRITAGFALQSVPSLKEKTSQYIDPSTGNLFHRKDGVEYTVSENAMIDKVNNEWGGDTILKAITKLTGLTREQAVQQILGQGGVVGEAKGRREAEERRRRGATATPKGGSSTGRAAPVLDGLPDAPVKADYWWRK